MMTRRAALLMPLLGLGVLGCFSPKVRQQSLDEADAAREPGARTIGDVSTPASLEATPLVGVGLVVGLNGTGGPSPPSGYRTQLETDLKKRKVNDVRAIIDSPNHAMVMV